MQVGTVVKIVQMDRAAACMACQRLVLVDAQGLALVAADQVDAAVGDRVLLLTGPAADRCAMDAPADAAVVAVVAQSGQE